MFSEATAAHPYSQRANIELGAHETGFLLGWIPASVANDAAAAGPGRRQSAALFYTKLNDGHERRVYAPERHHEIVGQTLGPLRAARHPRRCRLPDAELAERSEVHVEIDRDHNLALLTVLVPGADLETVVGRRAPPPLPPPTASTRSTSTCRWRRRRRRCVADDLERLGVSYAGVFPNRRTDGDVLRMQSLHRVRVKADDIAVASDHGRELLDYVLSDLRISASSVARVQSTPRSCVLDLLDQPGRSKN